MDGIFMNQIFGSEFIYGIDLGEGESQSVEFEVHQTSAKAEWKSKAEEVEYEDC